MTPRGGADGSGTRQSPSAGRPGQVSRPVGLGTARPPARGYGSTVRLQTKFEVLPWRWIVERTFAWLGRYRRLSMDYEGSEESSASWIYIAMTHLMLRRLDPA
jgi:transposase